MPTLILPPRFSDDSIRMWRAATSSGWDALRMTGWRLDDDTRAQLTEREVAGYGEPLFVAALAEQLGRVLLEPRLFWLPQLPLHYRRRAVRSGRFGALLTGVSGEQPTAPSAAAARTSAQPIDLPIFAKPADDKAFPARVYHSAKELAELSFVDADTPVLLSEPVHWSVEFRAFILDRRVVALSPYARDGALQTSARPGEPDGAERFLGDLLADDGVSIPPAVVVDVGEIRGRGWAVIEANPCFGAGLYECDPTAVLPVLKRAFARLDQLSAADKQWVLTRQS